MSWLSDFFTPPAAQVPLPQAPQVAGIPQAQGNIQNLTSGLGQYQTYNIPQAQGITQGLINDPNAALYTQGALGAYGLGTGAALNAYNMGGSLYPYAQGVMNTAFDPQQALYNRTLQQVQDQSRAGQAARGIAMTPYGAGLENQNINNFNIDWQNAQLQRQLAGLQGGGQAFGQAAGLQAGAAPLFMQSAQYPYAASQGVGGNQFGALSNLGQFGIGASTIPQAQIGANQNYLNYGNQVYGLQNQFANTALQQAGMGFQEQQANLQGLGRLAGMAGGFALGGFPGAAIGAGMFGGGGGGGGYGGGNPYAGFSTQPFGGYFR